jgi:hypothetical protein
VSDVTPTTPLPPLQRNGLLIALREIIDALDRRVPQFERAGEIRIARDALALRREAVERIGELERATGTRHDDELAEAVMTDDGGA